MMKLKIATIALVGLAKYLFIQLPLTVIGWIILPFILLFVPQEKEELPKIFALWDNFSGPEADGLAGDIFYRIRFNLMKWDATLVKYVVVPGYWRLWWRRYVWLAWRNPVDLSKGIILGKKIMWKGSAPGLRLSGTVDRRVDTGSDGFPGLVLRERGDAYKEFLWVSKPYNLFGRRVSQRARIGYKLEEFDLNYQPTHQRFISKNFLRFEFSYSPFHPYRGPAK